MTKPPNSTSSTNSSSRDSDPPARVTEGPDGREAVQRALMDRALAQAKRERERPRRHWLQHVLALGAAVALVGVIAYGFDAFLTAMQKYMETKVEDSPPAVSEPMPVYVVPPAVSPPPTADQGPRPSPAPAPDTSPATP